jgi:hypothetical protein
MKPVYLILIAAVSACATDSASHFRADCTVSVLGHASFQSLCSVDDMPGPGLNNRFRIVIKNAEGISPMDRIADYVAAAATANGHLQVSAILVGFIDVRPLDPDIRFTMMSSAPGYEVRAQNVAMTYLEDGSLQILIDEPCPDFNGKLPSPEWVSRHHDAYLQRSHAH